METPVAVSNARGALNLLDCILSPHNTTSQDRQITCPIFISIDLEYSERWLSELGVTVFDSALISTLELHILITNEYPIATELYRRPMNKYTCRRTRRKPFHFGTVQKLQPGDTRRLLEELLTPANNQGVPRDVVLVGHAIMCDIDVIKAHTGLDVRQLPAVRAVLDTQTISHRLLYLDKQPSLRTLLRILKLDYLGLHNAGNDSRHTMRALLLMYCKMKTSNQRSIETTSDEAERISLLEKIACYYKPRERITWCESTRVKLDGNSDLLDATCPDEGKDQDEGMLSHLFS